MREQCDKHNALLVYDEVQSGVGRTGELFAYMGLGITRTSSPAPRRWAAVSHQGHALTTTEIASHLKVGTHGSTYGGNPLACAPWPRR